MLFSKLIKWVNDTATSLGLQMQIHHCSTDVAVTQQFFDRMQISAGIEQMSRKGMPKGMSTKPFVLEASLLHC
jgi:hypothetical protein